MFNRRKGIEWQTDLYSKVLNFFMSENIVFDKDTYSRLASKDLQNLSISVFSSYGDRRSYQEKVSVFLQCYWTTIMEDISNLENNDLIHAPKLKEWFAYKEKLVEAMCMPKIKEEVDMFIKDELCKLSLDARRSILQNMYCTENIESWMMKTLNNCLWFNRLEICNDVQLALSKLNCTLHIVSEGDDAFNGFPEDERRTSASFSKQLRALNEKVESELDADPNVLVIKNSDSNTLVKNCANGTIQDPSSATVHVQTRKCKSSHKKLHRRPDKGLFQDEISKTVVEIFQQEDTNEQLQLFKKLIILDFLSCNDALKKYMNGTGRINRLTKKIILESIYDEENVKETHYSLLDLLLCKRYLIREKVEQVQIFFEKNGINFHQEIDGMSYFQDIEPTFHKVINGVTKAD